MQPAADGDPGHPGAGTATAACRRLSTAQDGALLISPRAFMSCSLRPGHSWGLDMLRPALGSNGKQHWKARARGMEQPAAGTPPFNPIIPTVLGAQHQHMLPCRASRPEFTPSSWGAQGPSSNNCSPARAQSAEQLQSLHPVTHRRRSGPRAAPRAQRVGVGAMLLLSQGQRFTFTAEQREPGHLD